MPSRVVEKFLATLESVDSQERLSKIQDFLNELVEEKEQAKDMHWTSLLLTEAIEITRNEIEIAQINDGDHTREWKRSCKSGTGEGSSQDLETPPLLDLFPTPVQLPLPQQQQQTPPLLQLFPTTVQLPLPQQQQQQQQQQVQPLLPPPVLPPPVQPVEKRRIVWTNEMKLEFDNCVASLGGLADATPKKIKDLMADDGPTLDELRSHLQWCRNQNPGN